MEENPQIKSRSYSIVLFFCILALSILIYGPLLKGHEVWFDDALIANWSQELRQPAQYIQKFFQYQTIDRQPVRDIVNYLQSLIAPSGEKFALYSHLLFWNLIAILLFQILQTQFPNQPQFNFFLIAYFAFHPLTVSSVAMYASLKHILSCFFSLLSVFFFQKYQKSKIFRRPLFLKLGTIISSILALLSQPLNLFLPLYFLPFIHEDKRKFFRANVRWILSLALVCILVAVDNWIFYHSDHYQLLIGQKFDSDQSLWVRLLIYGRSFFQIILPVSPSILPYWIYHPYSYLGLGLLGVFLFVLLWFRLGVLFMRWLPMMFLPLFVLTVKVTTQGGWDTYLLIPLAGWVLFLADLRKGIIQRYSVAVGIKNLLTILGGCVLGLNFFITWMHAGYFVSEEKILQRMAETEHSPLYRMMYAHKKLQLHLEVADEVLKEAIEVYALDPKTANLGYVFGRSLAEAPSLNFEEKRIQFEKIEIRSLWWFYWKAVFYIKNNQAPLAYATLQNGFSLLQPKEFTDMSGQWDQIIEKWQKMCQLAQAQGCEQIKIKVEEKIGGSL